LIQDTILILLLANLNPFPVRNKFW